MEITIENTVAAIVILFIIGEIVKWIVGTGKIGDELEKIRELLEKQSSHKSN